MRGTTFTKGKMNYFGLFSQQRTWAPLAQGASVWASKLFFACQHTKAILEGCVNAQNFV